jgi:hypothetical protein
MGCPCIFVTLLVKLVTLAVMCEGNFDLKGFMHVYGLPLEKGESGDKSVS